MLQSLKSALVGSVQCREHDEVLCAAWQRVEQDEALRGVVAVDAAAQGDAVWCTLDGWRVSAYEPSTAEPVYQVAGVDGSQIFPEHHEGWYGCVVNVGVCTLVYRMLQSDCTRESVPFVRLGVVYDELLVRQLRTCAERSALFQAAQAGGLVLADGGIPQQVPFDERSYAHVEGCFCRGARPANAVGYTSMPASTWWWKLLCRAAQGGLCGIPVMPDSAIVGRYIVRGVKQGTIGPWLAPGGSYDDTMIYWIWGYGEQCARLEVSQSLSHEALSSVFDIVFDQMRKGSGYPVALAEAHACAVLTERDRCWVMEHARRIASSRGWQISSGRSMKAESKRHRRV